MLPFIKSPPRRWAGAVTNYERSCYHECRSCVTRGRNGAKPTIKAENNDEVDIDVVSINIEGTTPEERQKYAE